MNPHAPPWRRHCIIGILPGDYFGLDLEGLIRDGERRREGYKIGGYSLPVCVHNLEDGLQLKGSHTPSLQFCTINSNPAWPSLQDIWISF